MNVAEVEANVSKWARSGQTTAPAFVCFRTIADMPNRVSEGARQLHAQRKRAGPPRKCKKFRLCDLIERPRRQWGGGRGLKREEADSDHTCSQHGGTDLRIFLIGPVADNTPAANHRLLARLSRAAHQPKSGALLTRCLPGRRARGDADSKLLNLWWARQGSNL